MRITFESRLSALHARKEELEAEIRQVDAEIQAAAPSGPAAPTPSVRQQPQPATAPAPAEPRQTLAQALVGVLRATGRAMKAQELADELVRRQFPTTSQNLAKMIGIKMAEYVQKGLVARVEGGEGYILPPTKAALKTKPAKVAPGKERTASNGHVSHNGSQPKLAATNGQPSLRSLLNDLLAKSKQPVKAKDLAAQVLATGYTTTSKSFINLIWVALGKMKDVEKVPDQGFRLKQAAGKAK
jgi:hypothetical protein